MKAAKLRFALVRRLNTSYCYHEVRRYARALWPTASSPMFWGHEKAGSEAKKSFTPITTCLSLYECWQILSTYLINNIYPVHRFAHRHISGLTVFTPILNLYNRPCYHVIAYNMPHRTCKCSLFRAHDWQSDTLHNLSYQLWLVLLWLIDKLGTFYAFYYVSSI